MKPTGWHRWALAAIAFLVISLPLMLIFALAYFPMLAITYVALAQWYPDVAGQISESPLKWALWVTLAIAVVEYAFVALPVIIHQREHLLASDLPKLERKIIGRHARQSGWVSPKHGATILASVIGTLFVLIQIGEFAFDGSTLRLVAVSALAIELLNRFLLILRGVLGRLVLREPLRGGESDALAEFDRQLENLLRRGYPRLAGLTPSEFTQHIEPLKGCLGGVESGPKRSRETGRIPFVIVIRQELAPADKAIELVERRGKAGTSVFDADDIRRLETIPTVVVPDGWAYLAFDIDTGRGLRKVAPDDALKLIEADQRSPLTVEEGIAVITHYPRAREAGWFSLPGTRRSERMVTALMVDEGRPTLGACEGKRPWIGSASCRERRASITSSGFSQPGQ